MKCQMEDSLSASIGSFVLLLRVEEDAISSSASESCGEPAQVVEL